MKEIIKIIKGDAPLSDVLHYIVGNYRYWLYYKVATKGNKPMLMRQHIFEQINKRCFEWMDIKCFKDGQCKICGCSTTALQMSNKACDKPCYPEMMYKGAWELFKVGKLDFTDEKYTWSIDKFGILNKKRNIGVCGLVQKKA